MWEVNDVTNCHSHALTAAQTCVLNMTGSHLPCPCRCCCCCCGGGGGGGGRQIPTMSSFLTSVRAF